MMDVINSKFSISISRSDRNSVSIEISDSASGDAVIDLSLSLEEYALAITGMYSPGVSGRFYQGCSVGLEREVKAVQCEKISLFDSEQQKEIVIADFKKNHEQDGWEMHHDGMRMKQSSNSHCYIIKRYIKIKGDE